MSKTTGLTKYECDRCMRTETLADISINNADWHDVTYVRSNSAEDSILLCKDCYKDYTNSFGVAQDQLFDKFMNRVGKDDKKE